MYRNCTKFRSPVHANRTQEEKAYYVSHLIKNTNNQQQIDYRAQEAKAWNAHCSAGKNMIAGVKAERVLLETSSVFLSIHELDDDYYANA